MNASLDHLLKNLDRGFYHEVARAPKLDPTLTGYGMLARRAKERGFAPGKEEIEQRATHMARRLNLPAGPALGRKWEYLERFAEETWALEQAVALHGIRLQGHAASTLDKFFTSGAATVLFPAWVETQAVVGMLEVSLVPSLVAGEVSVDSHLVQHVRLGDTAENRKAALGGQGARSPLVQLKTTDGSVKLQKYQAELQASYEALRLQKLNVVGLFLQRVGAQLGIDETDDLLEIAIAGDGNTGSAVVDTDALVPGVLDYAEIVRLSLAFPKGYQMRACVLPSGLLQTLLTLPEFKDPLAGFQYQSSGIVPNFIGAEWHRWSSTGSASFSTDRILALDRRHALVQYTEQALLIETDRLIDRQFERTVISKWTGFGKLDYNATQCLDVS